VKRQQRGVWLAGALVVALLAPTAASAQIRGFADVGATTFTAKQSFTAILGTNAGPVFGGGVDVRLPHNLFVSLRASRFTRGGHRLFLFEGQRFDLDVDTTVTITPVELSAGYRFGGVNRLAPYAGGGIGWHRYTETSDFAADADNVDERFTGYHLFGGAEYRVISLVAAAVEAQWTTVPDALGSDSNGVAAAFDEHDLGGFTVRVKVVIGR
jgi:opacity protein-like surface antigen